MMNIRHIRSVSFNTRRLKESEKFYAGPWGLTKIYADEERALFRGADREHHILELKRSDRTGLERFSIAVDNINAVNDAAAVAQARGVTIVDPPHHSALPGGGYHFVMLDPDENLVEISADREVHPDCDQNQGLPLNISHFILNTPDMNRLLTFYTEIVGFKISDRYENDLIVFLRCNEAHHCLALAKAPVTGIQHLAFGVADYDAIMRSVGRMRRIGVAPLWGVGRHGPGGNIFAYFADPDGHVIELTSDLVNVEDDYEPQIWKRSVENGDVWGSAGPPGDEVRRLWEGAREGFSLEYQIDDWKMD